MNSPIIPDEVASLARPHVGIIAQRSAIWGGTVCDLIIKGPTGDHEVAVAPKVDTFFLTRSNDPHPLVKKLNNEPRRSLVHPGAIVNFVAAGDRLVTQVRYGNNGMDRLAFSLLPHALPELEELQGSAVAPLRSELVMERTLPREILKTLAKEIITPGTCSKPLIDSLTIALIVDLIRHQNTAIHVSPVKGGLAPWQLRRARELIRDRLADDISLAELASLAELSRSHFARAFRRSTGLPPHQYQLTVRIERAKYLLRRGATTLTEIGLDCGFKQQSQFIRTFRRLVGVSPGVWQRMQKS